jgi:predicted protein tyrosine phosphatase
VNDRSIDGGIDEIPLPDGVTGRLWLCGKHRIGPDVGRVITETGADLVVCLTRRAEIEARYPQYVSWLDEHVRLGDAIWFPIHDLSAPDVESFAGLVDRLATRATAGDSIVVHCAAGIGRAGTTAVALLMRLGVDTDEARRIVRAHRPMAGPEVGAQVDLLVALARRPNA